MDLLSFMKQYADEIDGQFSGYDANNSIIIVPLSGGRFQTVIGSIADNQLYNRRLVRFTSKIVSSHAHLPLNDLLEQSSNFNYCRFVISDGYLQVEAVSALDSISESTAKEMIQEVANLADQYELKLTGGDVH